jgi:hypothetical protein
MTSQDGPTLKGYVEASGFPLTEIVGRKIPRIILGVHPYDATTYTSKERDEEYLRRWTGPRSMVELMKPVVERFGVTASRGFPSDSDLSRWHRGALRLTMDELDTEIAIVLGSILPTKGIVDTSKYVYRLGIKLGGEEFRNKWAGDPIYRYWHEKRKESQSDVDDFVRKASELSLEVPEEMKKVEVDYEKLDSMLESYRGFNIPLYVSNERWEFLVLARRFDELQEAADLVKRKMGTFLLGTHNAGLVIPMAEDARLRVDGYLTPVNKLGILMFPTQRLAEQAIRASGKPLVGIKPLGGGRVNPREAFQYVFHELGVPTTMVGIGSIEEAQETLSAAKTTLMT